MQAFHWRAAFLAKATLTSHLHDAILLQDVPYMTVLGDEARVALCRNYMYIPTELIYSFDSSSRQLHKKPNRTN
jgi:hypothetical protein